MARIFESKVTVDGECKAAAAQAIGPSDKFLGVHMPQSRHSRSAWMQRSNATVLELSVFRAQLNCGESNVGIFFQLLMKHNQCVTAIIQKTKAHKASFFEHIKYWDVRDVTEATGIQVTWGGKWRLFRQFNEPMDKV